MSTPPMVRETARIVAIRDGYMHLAASGGGGCGGCAGAGSCASVRFAGRASPTARELVLPLDGERRVGDLVELEIPESALLAASAAAYLPPLAGLIGGALAISPSGAALQPLGAALGLVAGLAASRILGRLHSRHLLPRPLQTAGPAQRILVPIQQESRS